MKTISRVSFFAIALAVVLLLVSPEVQRLSITAQADG